MVGKKGSCTISMKDSDFMDMATGKLGGQKVNMLCIGSVVFIGTFNVIWNQISPECTNWYIPLWIKSLRYTTWFVCTPPPQVLAKCASTITCFSHLGQFLTFDCICLGGIHACVIFPLQAFFEGKLKIAGNTALALKLQSIMPKPQSKL